MLSASHLSTADPSGEMLTLLVNAGAKVNIPRKTSQRFDHLIHMIQPHYIPRLLTLVRETALPFDIDARNSDGMTALHVACASLNGPKVRALVEAGANVKLTVNNTQHEQFHRKTAYELADMQEATTITQKYTKFRICKLVSSSGGVNASTSDETPPMLSSVDDWMKEMDAASASQEEQERLFRKLHLGN